MTSAQVPSRIAMPCPFGGFGTENITPIQNLSGADVNFPDGFPAIYGAPVDNNGRFVTRKEMNAIGNLASNDLFYHKCGGLNTFDAAFCAAVGGYPRGAILEYVAGTQIYNVMSLVDNNKVDFTGADHSSDGTGISTGAVDGVNWTYCNKDAPSQQVINVASGDGTGVSIDRSVGSIVSFFRAPANGMLTASISLEYGDPELSENAENCYFTGGQTITNVFCSGGLFARQIQPEESNIVLNVSNSNAWTCITSAVQRGYLNYNTTGIVQTSLAQRCYTLPTANNPSYGTIRVSTGTTYAIGVVISAQISVLAGIDPSKYGSTIRYNGYNVNLTVL